MKTLSSRVLIFLVGFLLSFAGGCSHRLGGKLTPDEAVSARQTIMEWLDCEECTDGELDQVVKLGRIAVPSLATVLEEALSPARRELLQRQATTSYRNLKDYEKTHLDYVVSMNSEEYIEYYVQSVETKHRVRSILGLSAIGGRDANQALRTARSFSLSNYEKNHLTRALSNAQ